MARFEVPEGWCVQAFRFTLDPTEDQARALARHFGARRKAYNWAVATLKADIEAWRVTGIGTVKPSLRVLRKRWNTVKDEVCVNAETGAVWWPECSKEAYADGIGGAVDAYWNWQNSRSGKREGKTMGFPRFKKKGRDQDRVTFTTGAMRVEPDRRHLTLPFVGPSVRTRTHAGLNGSSPQAGRGCWQSRCAVTAPGSTPVCGSSCNARSSPTWHSPVHGLALTSGCAGWPRSPTRRAQCSKKCPIHGHSTRHSKSYGTPAVRGRGARKAHGATASAPPRFPGCIAGSTMSALITCMS